MAVLFGLCGQRQRLLDIGRLHRLLGIQIEGFGHAGLGFIACSLGGGTIADELKRLLVLIPSQLVVASSQSFTRGLQRGEAVAIERLAADGLQRHQFRYRWQCHRPAARQPEWQARGPQRAQPPVRAQACRRGRRRLWAAGAGAGFSQPWAPLREQEPGGFSGLASAAGRRGLSSAFGSAAGGRGRSAGSAGLASALAPPLRLEPPVPPPVSYAAHPNLQQRFRSSAYSRSRLHKPWPKHSTLTTTVYYRHLERLLICGSIFSFNRQ